MTESAVRLGDSGQLFISGVLDCSAVTKSSSVGLSLLLCFMRDAEAAKKPVSIRAMPEDMREIAEVSGLTELLAHP